MFRVVYYIFPMYILISYTKIKKNQKKIAFFQKKKVNLNLKIH